MSPRKGLEGKVIIVSRFYWKDLLKITSKTQDGTVLIFYFGLPESHHSGTVQKFEEVIGLTMKVSTKDFPTKHKRYKKVEVRYQFETVDKAKECINCVKETYKKLKQKFLPLS